MEEQQFFVHFVVTDFDQIRTLVGEWHAVVDAISAQAPANSEEARLPYSFEQVEIDVDESLGPDDDVFLAFWAPPAMIGQFFRALRQKGLDFTQEFDTETPAIRCKLSPPAPEP